MASRRRRPRSSAELGLRVQVHGSLHLKILVLAQYFRTSTDNWIDNACEDSRFKFTKAAYPFHNRSWHARGAVTPLVEWLQLVRYANRALAREFDCVVTSFPQLALVVSLLSLIRLRRGTRIVAMNFNLGSVGNRYKGLLAGFVLRRVSRFAVHSSREIEEYSRWLNIPRERFVFFPLQGAEVETNDPSVTLPDRFMAAMGSANRDYETLVKAHEGFDVPLVIVAKRDILDRLPDRANLIKLSNLTLQECNSIMARAIVNIVPLKDTKTAAGQVTFVTTMRLGLATIVTRCVGSSDYIEDGVTGIFVDPGDHETLRRKMTELLEDDTLRDRISSAAKTFARDNLSDEAAARNLVRLLS